MELALQAVSRKMCRLLLSILVIAIYLNGAQVSAIENTTITPETESSTNKTTTIRSTESIKSNVDVTEIPSILNNTNTVNVEFDIGFTTKRAENKNVTNDEGTTDNERRSKKTTRSVENITENPITVNHNARRHYKSEQEIQEIIDSIINDPLIHYRRNDGDADERQRPGYFGKLTGNLVMPVLKARNSITKGLGKSTKGILDIGTGTFQAASGAVGLLRDASKAVLTSG